MQVTSFKNIKIGQKLYMYITEVAVTLTVSNIEYETDGSMIIHIFGTNYCFHILTSHLCEINLYFDADNKQNAIIVGTSPYWLLDAIIVEKLMFKGWQKGEDLLTDAKEVLKYV